MGFHERSPDVDRYLCLLIEKSKMGQEPFFWGAVHSHDYFENRVV